MTPLEKQVWVAAFAAEFARERKSRFITPGAGSIDDIDGYDCAGVADVAVEKFRDALASDEYQHLDENPDGGGQ